MSKEKEERRYCPIELRNADGQPPRLAGYAAVFDSLSENLGGFREKIAPGAFDQVLNDDVRALVNHDPNLILGRTISGTLKISLDNRGLFYEIDVPDTAFARDLMQSVKRGDVSQSSFAFRVEDDRWDEDDDGRYIRTIKKVKRLYDVSPVTYSAYPDTDVATRAMQSYQQQQSNHVGVNARLSARAFLLQENM